MLQRVNFYVVDCSGITFDEWFMTFNRVEAPFLINIMFNAARIHFPTGVQPHHCLMHCLVIKN